MSEWGLFGLAASALFWSGRDFAQTGVYAIMEWEVVQIPVYAWKPDGNPTKQLFDGVMGMTDRTTVNGVVTDFSQVAVNVVGIIIVI